MLKQKYIKVLCFILCIMFTVVIGYIRYSLGVELAFSIFYLIPITMTTMVNGRISGIFMSIFSTASWLIADVMLLENFSGKYIPFLNETFRFIVFLFIVFLVSKLMHLLHKQEEIAATDPLTGIANRRFFYKQAENELKRIQRHKYPLSIAYIDLDNFKFINDKFGHNEGDHLLNVVAQSIKKNIRTIDIFARLGGDEFAILFIGSGAEAAFSISNKLNTNLLRLMKEHGWPVTFSIGIVTYETPPSSVDELINCADKLMYQSKRSGRNMISSKLIN
ncbi:MAG: GGDEF domain-containing protein [Spirochaetota bacterium]|nr:GGDEF domain-containing protein [Spirochaetota bacterium]